jgi:hypothetical protein
MRGKLGIIAAILLVVAYGWSYSDARRSYSSSSSYSRSAPSRSYSTPSRSYSTPSRTYSAPSRTYSAPSYLRTAPSSGSKFYQGGQTSSVSKYYPGIKSTLASAKTATNIAYPQLKAGTGKGAGLAQWYFDTGEYLWKYDTLGKYVRNLPLGYPVVANYTDRRSDPQTRYTGSGLREIRHSQVVSYPVVLTYKNGLVPRAFVSEDQPWTAPKSGTNYSHESLPYIYYNTYQGKSYSSTDTKPKGVEGENQAWKAAEEIDKDWRGYMKVEKDRWEQIQKEAIAGYFASASYPEYGEILWNHADAFFNWFSERDRDRRTNTR